MAAFILVVLLIVGGIGWFMTTPASPTVAVSSATKPALPTAPVNTVAATRPEALAPIASAEPMPSAPTIPEPTSVSTTSVPALPAPTAPTSGPAPAGEPSLATEDVISRAMPAVVTIEAGTARGSGFYVAPDTLLTNVHVVSGNVSVTVRRADGTTTPARVEKTSDNFDVAVLKVTNPAPSQATIPMASAATARVGQEVLAIGSPLGFLHNTVTRGIVSAVRQVGAATLVQTDAPLNPGNSGGPLLNRSGAVIAITTSGFKGADGLSFAVAIDHARALLEGRATPVPTTTAADSSYRVISPSLDSAADQRRKAGDRSYEQVLAQLAHKADGLDDYWRRFRTSCFEGRALGSYDREWFAVWDARAMHGGSTVIGCSNWFEDVKSRAAEIRAEVLAADEAARQADVYPGTRRDLRRKYRLDYSGWNR